MAEEDNNNEYAEKDKSSENEKYDTNDDEYKYVANLKYEGEPYHSLPCKNLNWSSYTPTYLNEEMHSSYIIYIYSKKRKSLKF